MDKKHPLLSRGYSSVPPGQIATVVTCLEMLAPPEQRPVPESNQGLVVERWHCPANDEYRALFRAVGERWMWVSRLEMEDAQLEAILQDPAVEVYVLREEGKAVGLLELDFRDEGECELAFFGVVPEAIGKGAGRLLMNHAVGRAWSRPIRRFWVHTCHLDSPQALSFYQRSGFKPYAILVEVMDDPRLSGLVPRDASPHIPLIEN
jgi:GNAT superfamily N-acetyltransferase